MNAVYDVFHYRNVKLLSVFELHPCIIQYYDLTMVLTGELTYRINEQQITLKPGDIMLLPPGTRRARYPQTKEVHYISFNFFTERQFDLPLIMRGAVTAEIRALFKAFTPPHLSVLDRGMEKAACIVGYILEALRVSNQHSNKNPHIQKALSYIDEHIFEPISLSSLAVHLHLSREYTASIFKKEVGIPVSAYVNEKKLLLARDLIRDDEYSLTDIAKMLGYANYGYFSRLFKKRFGSSPSQYQS
jgi:AraC-like DNA-binding protein